MESVVVVVEDIVVTVLNINLNHKIPITIIEVIQSVTNVIYTMSRTGALQKEKGVTAVKALTTLLFVVKQIFTKYVIKNRVKDYVLVQ